MSATDSSPRPAPVLLAIGELAEKTGLSPERLRSWEQRYGVPKPVRLDSGHRRYQETEVSFLMDVGRLLALGFKASELLRQTPEELRGRLEKVGTSSFDELEFWISMVERFDGKGLRGALEEASSQMSLVELLDKRISPFLWQIGERWSRGEMRVSHEHFATIRLSQFLSDLVPGQEVTTTGVKVLLATLPGDLHGLAISMADAVLKSAGVETIVLGADNPVKEIASTANSADVSHIALSISRSAGQKGVGKILEELIEMVPDRELLLGGGGVSVGIRLPKDVRQFRTMVEFQRWIEGVK